jgi:hypothetical protein
MGVLHEENLKNPAILRIYLIGCRVLNTFNPKVSIQRKNFCLITLIQFANNKKLDIHTMLINKVCSKFMCALITVKSTSCLFSKFRDILE